MSERDYSLKESWRRYQKSVRLLDKDSQEYFSSKLAYYSGYLDSHAFFSNLASYSNADRYLDYFYGSTTENQEADEAENWVAKALSEAKRMRRKDKKMNPQDEDELVKKLRDIQRQIDNFIFHHSKLKGQQNE